MGFIDLIFFHGILWLISLDHIKFDFCSITLVLSTPLRFTSLTWPCCTLSLSLHQGPPLLSEHFPLSSRLPYLTWAYNPTLSFKAHLPHTRIVSPPPSTLRLTYLTWACAPHQISRLTYPTWECTQSLSPLLWGYLPFLRPSSQLTGVELKKYPKRIQHVCFPWLQIMWSLTFFDGQEISKRVYI